MQSHNTGLPRMTRIMMNIAQNDAEHEDDLPTNIDNGDEVTGTGAGTGSENPSRAKGSKKKSGTLPPITNSGALVPMKSQSLQLKKMTSEGQG